MLRFDPAIQIADRKIDLVDNEADLGSKSLKSRFLKVGIHRIDDLLLMIFKELFKQLKLFFSKLDRLCVSCQIKSSLLF